MILIAGGLIVLVRWLVSPKAESSLPTAVINQNAPTAGTLPSSTNPGVQSWSGILGLGQTVTLSTGNKIYSLFIKGGASAMLGQQGYKTGDKIVVMGRLKDNVIEVVGVTGTAK